jgi:hypothetical protein
MIVSSPIDGVQGQLQSIRSSHFVKDPKQIVPNGVLAQFELLGNVTIGETFGHQMDNAFFPLCQQARFPQRNCFGGQSRAQTAQSSGKYRSFSPPSTTSWILSRESLEAAIHVLA